MMSNMIPGLVMILFSIVLPVIPNYFRHPAMLLSVFLSSLSLFNGYGIFLEWDILGLNLILYEYPANNSVQRCSRAVARDGIACFGPNIVVRGL